MLTLSSNRLCTQNLDAQAEPMVVRLVASANVSEARRHQEAFIVRGVESGIPSGFRIYVVPEKFASDPRALPPNMPAVIVPDAYGYLAEGDILRIVPATGSIRVLFRKSSKHNSFLLTERCNNYCLMCSQPPKSWDDSWLVDEVLAVIPLIDPDAREIGFTGGEPTLLGDDLIRMLLACKTYLPQTALHVLSNGRRFADYAFAREYAAVQHPDIMVGIPLYSDLSNVHDYVVQADGAYDDTIRGVLNLKRLGQRVEIRVVIHKITYDRLPELANFIARNLLFVDHVALMGLEMTGFTRANLEELWIDPFDYREHLYKAVKSLAGSGMNVSIYNHQLCTLPSELWAYARQSISDWKNEYMPECEGCTKRADCGGFFSSAKMRYSSHILPIG
jgi:His-Xaa-Ser system radical SAM maturase HxsC